MTEIEKAAIEVIRNARPPTAENMVDGLMVPAPMGYALEMALVRAGLYDNLAGLREQVSTQPACAKCDGQGAIAVETGVVDEGTGIKEWALEPCACSEPVPSVHGPVAQPPVILPHCCKCQPKMECTQCIEKQAESSPRATIETLAGFLKESLQSEHVTAGTPCPTPGCTRGAAHWQPCGQGPWREQAEPPTCATCGSRQDSHSKGDLLCPLWGPDGLVWGLSKFTKLGS